MPKKKSPMLVLEHGANAKAHGLTYLCSTNNKIFSWRKDKASLEEYARRMGRKIEWG